MPHDPTLTWAPVSHDPASERARHLLKRATASLSPAREKREVKAVAEDEKEHAKARQRAAAEKVKAAIRLKDSQDRVIRRMAAAKGPIPAPAEPEVYTLYKNPDAVAGWLAERKARVTQDEAGGEEGEGEVINLFKIYGKPPKIRENAQKLHVWPFLRSNYGKL